MGHYNYDRTLRMMISLIDDGDHDDDDDYHDDNEDHDNNDNNDNSDNNDKYATQTRRCTITFSKYLDE